MGDDAGQNDFYKWAGIHKVRCRLPSVMTFTQLCSRFRRGNFLPTSQSPITLVTAFEIPSMSWRPMLAMLMRTFCFRRTPTGRTSCWMFQSGGSILVLAQRTQEVHFASEIACYVGRILRGTGLPSAFSLPILHPITHSTLCLCLFWLRCSKSFCVFCLPSLS